jgi:hypothetical protein
MREKRRSNDLSTDVTRQFSFILNVLFYLKKEEDVLRQAVEQEYTTLYRQVHKAAQETAR